MATTALLRRVLASILLLAACARANDAGTRIVLATTTSVEDSGLLTELLHDFHAAHADISITVIAVGSGEALAYGRRKDADVLIVHSPAAESSFVAGGYATRRRPLMTNEFILVGPASDPANVRAAPDALDALRRIAAAGARFVSRGDDSGTHARERALWAALGLEPRGDWYMEAGLGMADVLRIASERRGYTLSDESTFTFLRDGLELEPLLRGDPRLTNHYSVIEVRGAAQPEAAALFADWLTDDAGQRTIAEYGRARFGRPLFAPAGG